MKVEEFKAFCPFEIGDVISEKTTGVKCEIIDIAIVYYSKTRKTEFLYAFENRASYLGIREEMWQIETSIG